MRGIGRLLGSLVLGCHHTGRSPFPPDARACAIATPTSGGVSYAIAAGDLNVDGRVDIVTANYNRNTVSVLLGNGDGTFSAPNDFDVGGRTTEVVVDDFNADGKPDVAALTDARVMVMLGNGDGSLRMLAGYIENQPSALATARLISGASSDLAVTVGSSSITLLVGNGDGTFHYSTYIEEIGTNADAVAIADINADGKQDLIVGAGGTSCLCFFNCSPCTPLPGGVAVLLGMGDGTFTPRAYVNGDAYWLAVGDLDVDGKPDFVVSTFGLPRVFLGVGDGTFRPGPSLSFEDGVALTAALADLDGDGQLDLVEAFGDLVSGSLMDTVGFRHGHGDGSFDDPIAYAVGADPRRLAIADVDNNGVPDVLVASDRSETISVLLDGCFR